jgi:hypothetical protein
MINQRILDQKSSPRKTLLNLVRRIRHTHQPTGNLQMPAYRIYLLPRLSPNLHTTARVQRIEYQRTSDRMILARYRPSRGYHIVRLARQTESLGISHRTKIRRARHLPMIQVLLVLVLTCQYQLKLLYQSGSHRVLETGTRPTSVLAQPMLQQVTTYGNHSHTTTLLAARLITRTRFSHPRIPSQRDLVSSKQHPVQTSSLLAQASATEHQETFRKRCRVL